MDHEKDIAYSDFFKEDPFHYNPETSPTETLPEVKSEPSRPILKNIPRADEADLRRYHKALHRYFTSGIKTTESLKKNLAPVLLAPYLRGIHPDLDYPFFYDEKTGDSLPVRELLIQTFQQSFKEDEARILSNNLLRLELYLRQSASKIKPVRLAELLPAAINELKTLEVHGEEGKQFQQQCDQLSSKLSQHHGFVLGYSPRTPFQLLNLELKKRNTQTKTLLEALQKHIDGLQDLLHLYQHDDASAAPVEPADEFTASIISLDVLETMRPAKEGSGLSPERLERLHRILDTLKNAHDFFRESRNIIFVTADLAKEFGLEATFHEAKLDITSGHPCAKAEAYFRFEMGDLIQFIAALRTAELELANAYDEDLHNEYFDQFGFINLREEDIQLLPALIVVAESQQLLQEPEDLLALLTDNAPIKVLAVNRLEELRGPINDPDLPAFRQELAALALSHRNAYIYQGGADLPVSFHHAVHEGLSAPMPVLWNLLFPNQDQTADTAGYLAVHTAIESRLFPRLIYNIRAGGQFGSRFNISDNPQPVSPFEIQSIEIQSGNAVTSMDFPLTMAEFYTMDPEVAARLEVIPPKFHHEELIPLDQYLTMSPAEVQGTIPVIWMVDEKNNLYQAAIPFSWLGPCKERLDNWQFIQELGGVNSYHVHVAIEQYQAEWEAAKAEEIAQLKAEMDAEIERIRKEEGGKAMDRLVNVLLDLDQVIPSSPTVAVKTPAPSTVTEEPIKAEVQASEPVEEETEVSAEAWVETFRCTTCNDCINAVPGVFKYNGDKQAFVHNPQGGTYALIVAAAEKCPAKCIHPGLPQNPAEPNLEALIKRAEKFN